MGRDAQLASRFHRDLTIDRCRGGATWSSILQGLQRDLQPWDHATSTFQVEKGSVILWLSGNDIHDKRSGKGAIDEDVLMRMSQDIRAVISILEERGARSIVVLGPLPRPNAHKEGIAWEKTASYHMERTTKKVLDAMATSVSCVLSFVTLGRALTKKLTGRHSVRRECRAWYHADAVHPNSDGYDKLADMIPVWLRFTRCG